MQQVFHYTRHNSQNQALAATRLSSDRLRLMRYCLHHSLEEAGHDLMVVSDLKSIGESAESVAGSKPLVETQAFVAYLYRVAAEQDPAARLGYTHWAEGASSHIAELITAMRRDLGLRDNQMTFFVSHAQLDADHLAEVKQVIADTCTTQALQDAVVDVAVTSLALTGHIMDGALRAYQTVQGGAPA